MCAHLCAHCVPGTVCQVLRRGPSPCPPGACLLERGGLAGIQYTSEIISSSVTSALKKVSGDVLEGVGG